MKNKLSEVIVKRMIEKVKGVISGMNGTDEILRAISNLSDDQEFQNEINSIVIENNNDLSQNNNQVMQNNIGIPYQEYNRVVIELNECAKRNEEKLTEYIVEYSYDDILNGNPLNVKKVNDNCRVEAPNKYEAIKLFNSEIKQQHWIYKGIVNKDEIARFSEDDLDEFFSSVSSDVERIRTKDDLVNYVFGNLLSGRMTTSYFKRFGVEQRRPIGLEEGSRYIVYEFNECERELINGWKSK